MILFKKKITIEFINLDKVERLQSHKITALGIELNAYTNISGLDESEEEN